MNTARRLLLVTAAFSLLPACGTAPPRELVPPITILVDVGGFPSVESAAAGEARVTIWGDSSRMAAACTESFAALELRNFLARRCGLPLAQFRLDTARTLPPAGDVFVLGSGASNRLISSLAPAPGGSAGEPDGFRIRMLNRGSRRVVVIAGNGRTGTLYGTYEFLQRLGMRFYGLGDTGTVVPPPPARLPRKLEIAESPRFRTRGFWAFEPRGDSTFFLWMARNRMNLWTSETPDPGFLHKLGVRLTGGGHRVQADDLDPRAVVGGRSRFAAHPEWYGLIGGVRRGDIAGETGTNFCTSNGSARHELARNLVAELVAGRLRNADVVEVWPLDGGRWCECDSCRAEGTPTDRWLDVVAAVNAEVRTAREQGRLGRAVELVAPAYFETLSPPTRAVSSDFDPASCSVAFFPYYRCYAHALADSSCTELNLRLARAYDGWAVAPDRFYRGRLSIGEYYNVSWVHSLPIVYASVMSEDLPWYARNGADGVFYMHAPTRLWGAWTLNHAVYARALWNPDSARSVADAFCREYFGPAAGPMGMHLSRLEVATMNITALAHCVGAFGTSGGPPGRLANPAFPLFPLHHLQLRGERPFGPGVEDIAELMRDARAYLDSARAVPTDPIVRARIDDEERRFEYGEAMFDFWLGLIRVAAAHRAQNAAAARREWPAVENAATRLRAIHELVQVAASHANARGGLEASQVVPTYEFFRRLYGR